MQRQAWHALNSSTQWTAAGSYVVAGSRGRSCLRGRGGARTGLFAAPLCCFVTQVQQLARCTLPYFSLEGRAQDAPLLTRTMGRCRWVQYQVGALSLNW